ncbi:PAS domain-containing protein [Shewanella seohaensis]|nr:PAS domain-containing protein [Shewanella seohaensis]
MRKNLPVTQREYDYPADWILLSTTDTKSHITYANPSFCTVAGYELSAMLGQPHNMVRHPDMPPQAFEDLWKTIRKGEEGHSQKSLRQWRPLLGRRLCVADYGQWSGGRISIGTH